LRIIIAATVVVTTDDQGCHATFKGFGGTLLDGFSRSVG